MLWSACLGVPCEHQSQAWTFHFVLDSGVWLRIHLHPLYRSKLIALSAAEHLVEWRNGASSPLLHLRFGSLVKDAVVDRVDQQRGLLLQLPSQERVTGYARLFQLADEKVTAFFARRFDTVCGTDK